VTFWTVLPRGMLEAAGLRPWFDRDSVGQAASDGKRLGYLCSGWAGAFVARGAASLTIGGHLTAPGCRSCLQCTALQITKVTFRTYRHSVTDDLIRNFP